MNDHFGKFSEAEYFQGLENDRQESFEARVLRQLLVLAGASCAEASVLLRGQTGSGASMVPWWNDWQRSELGWPVYVSACRFGSKRTLADVLSAAWAGKFHRSVEALALADARDAAPDLRPLLFTCYADKQTVLAYGPIIPDRPLRPFSVLITAKNGDWVLARADEYLRYLLECGTLSPMRRGNDG